MDFSFVELVLVAVIAFLVLGPEELIRKSQQVGRWVGKARTYGNNLRVLAEEEFSQASPKNATKKENATEKGDRDE